MERSKPLKRRLARAARRYHNENETVDIRWTSEGGGRVTPDEDVYLNPGIHDDLGIEIEDEANQYRLLRQTTAHEVAHINYSVLTGKTDFAEAYPGLGKIAGMVVNIMEDVYVDARVRSEYPGMRPVYAFEAEKQMESDHRSSLADIREAGDEYGVEQRIEGLIQLALCGWVKGYGEAEEDVKDFLARQRPRIEAVEDEHNPAEREALAHDVMEDLAAAIPEEARERAERMADLIDGLRELLRQEAGNPERAPDTPDDRGIENAETDEDVDPEDIEEEPEHAEPEEDQEGEGGGVPEDDPESHDQPNAGQDETEPAEPEEAEPEQDAEGDPQDGDSEEESNETPTPDSGPGDGETPDTDAETKQDEELQDNREELEHADEEGMPEGRFLSGHEGDLDRIEEPSERDERAVEEIKQEIAETDTEFDERLRDRDSRLEDIPRGETADDVRRLNDRTGTIDEVREAFEDIATADGEPLSEEGYRLDDDMVVERAAGNLGITEYHRESTLTETGNRAVSVALDTSGSMSSTDMKRAKLAIAALAEATDAIGDQFTASAFTTQNKHRAEPHEEMFDLKLVTGPDEDFKMDHLNTIESYGAEPTFAGVRDAANLLDRCDREKELMFVITDGKATVGATDHTYGEGPVRDARDSVNEARAEGIEVVGLGLGGGISEEDLDKTFGSSGYTTADADTLAETLIDEYKRTLDTYDGY